MTEPSGPVTVGRILLPHGVHGEVKVEPLSDHTRRFQRGSRLWLDGEELTVERGRRQGKLIILKLQDVDSRAQADALRGKELTVPEPARLQEEGVYYLHDIVGLEVRDPSGAVLGRVVNVLATGSNDVYVVQGERGELLLPALDDVVTAVDLQARTLTADLPQGLDWHAAATGPLKRAAPRGPRRRPEMDTRAQKPGPER